ncbi:MAG: alpha-mannosidase, partial [Candidatus Hydrogenedentes bacterium]|nr:alpha-mannosidase [Candidatus Hydrogenedentota bacterium]
DVLFKTAQTLAETSMRRARIIDRLNEAINLVPFHPVSSEELESTCRAARKHIAPLLKDKNGPTTPHIGIVGHAHLDIGWLWPVRETVRKSARTFSTFVRLMEEYPELTFVQSQAVLLDMVEKHYPALIPQIQKLYKKGNWQPNGGMWVESDCNLPSGESLVRQFIEGRKMTMKLFGYQADTLWLPDVFGYSAALPQILKQCEIKNFVTNKIGWNDTNEFPRTTFWWEGIDGTEVFAHFISNRSSGYNANIDPKVARESWDRVRYKEAQDSTICAVGWGDGGGGVTREICERVRRMNDLEGCNKTSFVNLSEFLAKMREQDIARPRWVGELYLECHRGTYTTQARTKRYNRKLEFLLRDVELLSVMAGRFGFVYPKAALQRNWRTLLTNQFHDIIPGSSIRKVYEVAESEYAQMENELGELKNKALARIAKAMDTRADGTPYLVANTLSWNRDEIVVVEDKKANAAYDKKGNVLPVQPLENGLAVLTSVAGLSAEPIFLNGTDRETIPSPFKYSGKKLDTPHYRVTFDKSGKITGLFDKSADREIVKKGGRLNDLYTAEDAPLNYDAWDIELYYRDQIKFEDRLQSREVVADGPLLFTIRSRYAIGKQSTLTQDMTFYSRSRRIDFKTEVDWHETHVILKSGFAIDVLADTCKHEIQFGHLDRPTHQNTSFDLAKFETCSHKWVDLSENGYGVALLNDCKYGHDTLDGMVSISLLKSPVAPDPIADRGRHEFTYALLPHTGGFSVEQVVRQAYALNVPITCIETNKSKGAQETVTFCSVSNPNVIVETVKHAEEEDATIVRVYEAGKSRGATTIRFDLPVKRVTECNLIERQDRSLKVKNNSITFKIKPFEIKTFKVFIA